MPASPNPTDIRTQTLPPSSQQTARTITLLLVTALTIMAGATIAPSLPAIEKQFANTPNVAIMTRLLLTVPALTIALFAALVGWLIDRFGRKRILVGSVFLYVVAGSSGLYLDSLLSILVGRALLGVAVAGTLTCATTLVGDYYTGAERGRVVGLQGAVSAFGGVLFLLLGGFLAEIGWRVPFVLYFVAVLLLPPAMRVLYEPSRPSDTETAAHRTHTPARVVALIVTVYAVMFGLQIAFYMVPVQIPFFVAELGVTNPSLAGVALAVMTLFAALVAVSFRWVQRALDRVTIVAVSLTVVGAGLLVVSGAASYARVLVGMAIVGAGMGLNFPNLASWLLDRAPAMIRGRVIGGLTTFAFLGQFFSPIVTAPVIRSAGLAGGYRAAGLGILACAALFAVGAVLTGRLAAVRPNE